MLGALLALFSAFALGLNIGADSILIAYQRVLSAGDFSSMDLIDRSGRASAPRP